MANAFDQFDAPESANPFDQFDVPEAPVKKQNAGIGGDLATDLKRGVQSLPGMAAGLADIPVAAVTGRPLVSEAAQAIGGITGFTPGQWAKDAAAEYSPDRLAANQETDAAWKDGSATDIARAYLSNPMHKIVGPIVESAPSMLVGGLAGRAVGAAAKLAPAISAGIGEGGVMAGQAMQGMLDNGVDPREAAGYAGATGVAGGLVGTLGGRVAQKMGLVDPDVAIAGGVLRAEATGATGLAAVKEAGKRILGGGAAEGLVEEVPQSLVEQGLSNLAQGAPVTEGMARAGVEGGLAGFGMGAAFNALPARAPVHVVTDPTTGADVTVDPTAGPLSASLATTAQLKAAGEVDTTGQQTIDTIDQGLDTLDAAPAQTGATPDTALPIIGQESAPVEAQPIYTGEAPNQNDESLRAYFQAQRAAAAADRSGAAIPDSVRETAETRPQIAPVELATEPSRTKVEQSIEPVQRVDLAVAPSVTRQQLADNEAGQFSTPRDEQLYTEDPVVQPTQGAPNGQEETTQEVLTPAAPASSGVTPTQTTGITNGTPSVETVQATQEGQAKQPAAPVARPAAILTSPHVATITAAMPDAQDVQVHSSDSLGSEMSSVSSGQMGKWRAKTIERIARAFGRKKVVFFSSSNTAADGMTIGNKSDTLYININAGVDPLAVVGHEWRHTLEQTNKAAHAAIQTATRAILAKDGKLLEFAKQYHGQEMKGAASPEVAARMARIEAGQANDQDMDFLAEEFSADITGNMWRDPAALKEVFDTILEQHPPSTARSIVKAIGDALLSLINKLLLSTPRSQFSEIGVSREELLGLKKEIQAAMVDSFRKDMKNRMGARSGGVKFSTAKEPIAAGQHTMEIDREDRELAASTYVSRAEEAAIAAQAKKFGLAKVDVMREVRRIKKAFPTTAGWAPIEFAKINAAEYKKKQVINADTVNFQKMPYAYHLGKAGRDDVATHDKRIATIAKGMSDEIIGQAERAAQGDKNAEVMINQIEWYRKVSSLLHHQFGGFSDFLAQLMGPTSANTPVEGNAKYAMGALKSATSGKWDGIVRDAIAWREGVMSAAAKLDAIVEANRAKPKGERLTVKELAKTPAFRAAEAQVAAAAKYQGESPRQDSGAQFGMATQGIVEILANTWSDFQRGDAPKTKNYYQNLIGRQFDGATIDVWAARSLRRFAGLLRIPSAAEKGVAGKINADLTPGGEFGFGQEAFSEAAAMLRKSGIPAFAHVTPADLQAMIWFSEKELWAKNSWTTKIGEGGSMEAELNLLGEVDRAHLQQLRVASRKGLPHEGNTKPLKSEVNAFEAARDGSTDVKGSPAFKARLEKLINKAIAIRENARIDFEKMRGTVDRYIAGYTPATDFTPSDAKMAEERKAIEDEVLRGRDSSRVLAFKAMPTMGRYGYDERSMDIEGITRQGYNGRDMLVPLLKGAKRNAQDGLMFGRVLRADEDVDYLKHRPGLELYFDKGKSMAEAQPLLDKLNALGFQQFTFAVDPVRTPSALSGEMGDAIGLRYVFTPEFALREPNTEYGGDPSWSPKNLTDEEIRTRMESRSDALFDLADELRDVPGVSFAERLNYEADVYFWGNYDDALGNIGTGSGAGSSQKQWQGQQIRAGLERADRRREVSAGTDADFNAARDVLRRDAGVKRSTARSDGTGSDELRAGPAGAVRQDAVSATGVHYSKQQRSTLSSSAFGTGLKGDELDRLAAATDPRIKQRIYFYANTGKGIKPEAGVGIHAHQAQLGNLYDLSNDPRDLAVKHAGNSNAFESAVLDAGFDGVISQGYGIAVLLGPRAQDVEYIGTDDRPQVAQAGVAEKSSFGKLQQSVMANNSLPGGEMDGASWKRMMPKLMPEIDVSHLDDGAKYYKDQLVKRPVKKSPARQALEWKEQTSNDVGPVYQGDGFQLKAVRKFDTATDFTENGLPWGHNAQVQGEAYRFAIREGRAVVGFLDAEVNGLDEISAIHDMKIETPGQGLGAKVVETIMASTYDGVRVIDVLPQSERFWDRLGAGYLDINKNTRLDFEGSPAEARGRNARGQAGRAQGAEARQEAARFSTSRLAPNGKPSRLDEKQYAQVRTPEFKAWFGDWEAAHDGAGGNGVWASDNVSKVVDENGEPLVVYHGTKKGGFTTFAPDKGNHKRSPMIFAAATRDTARTYSGRGQEIDLSTFDEDSGDFDTQSGIYPLFLNIRDPNEANFDGANWDGQRLGDQFVIWDSQEGEYVELDIGAEFASEDEANALYEELGGDEVEFDGRPRYEVQNAPDHHDTTNGVAEEAKRTGNDGAIIRQVVDDGGNWGSADVDDVFVFFDANQAKSATQNTGAFSKAKDDIRFSTPRGAIGNQPINQAWQSPDNLGPWDNFVRTMQDKLVDTKRVLAAIREAGIALKDNINPYLQEVLYHGRAAKRVSDFADSELRPFLVEMSMRKIERQDLEDYLWARHATERNAQIAKVNPAMPDAGSGLTNQQAADILAGQLVTIGGRDIKLDTAKMPGMQSLAKRVDAMTKETTDTLVRYGLETQDTVDAWRATYGKYVPLMRDMESDDNYAGAFNLGLGTGQGFSVRGSAAKRAMGSERGVIDILANVAMQRERAIVRGEKNRVAQSLYGLSVTAPNPDFWLPLNPDAKKTPATVISELVQLGLNPIDAANIANEPKQRYTDPATGMVMERINPQLRTRGDVLAVRINGKDRYVMFSSNERAQQMVRNLKNLDAEQLGLVMQKMAVVTRWFAAINTQFNPVFGLTNGVRDLGTGMLNLTSTELKGQQAEVFKNAFSALRGVYSDLRDHRAGRVPSSKWALAFEEFASEGGQTGYRDMFQTSKDRTDALMKELKDATKGKTLLTFSERRSPLFGWLSDYNTAIENAVRLSAYQAAKDKGMSKQQAASLAKNLTVNFNKKGLAATQLGAMYAFFNAAVQGTARIGTTMITDDNGKPSLTAAGKKILYGGMMAGVLQAAMFAAAGYDDEEPPQFAREKNFIIPLPGGKYISVPYPMGFHAIPNIGRIATEFALGGFKNPGQRLVDMFSMVLDGFNPIGGSSGGVSQLISPTVTDPFVALSENKDWTGKNIYKEDFNKMHPTAGWTRKKDSASIVSNWLAYGVNYLTGGGKYEIGLLSPTPDQLDYIIGQATGGVGRETLKAWQFGATAASGEDMPMYKVPVAGRFVGETTGQASETSKFYNSLKRIGEHKSALDEMKDARDLPAMMAYRKANPDAMLVKAADQASTDISKLKRRKRELLEKNASKEQVKMIDAQLTARVKMWNSRLSAKPWQEQRAE